MRSARSRPSALASRTSSRRPASALPRAFLERDQPYHRHGLAAASFPVGWRNGVLVVQHAQGAEDFRQLVRAVAVLLALQVVLVDVAVDALDDEDAARLERRDDL